LIREEPLRGVAALGRESGFGKDEPQAASRKQQGNAAGRRGTAAFAAVTGGQWSVPSGGKDKKT